jgi:hypothetical protein
MARSCVGSAAIASDPVSQHPKTESIDNTGNDTEDSAYS